MLPPLDTSINTTTTATEFDIEPASACSPSTDITHDPVIDDSATITSQMNLVDSSAPPDTPRVRQQEEASILSTTSTLSNSSMDWEEPHPGRRLSYDDAAARRDSNGGAGGSMAAKDCRHPGPYQDRGHGARRVAHPRLRLSSLKPLMIPAQVPEEHNPQHHGMFDIRSAPLPEKQGQTFNFSSDPIIQSAIDKETGFPPGAVIVDPVLEADDEPTLHASLGKELEAGVMVTTMATATPVSTPVSERPCSGLYFSDFSNHLSKAFGEPRPSEDSASLSTHDSDVFSRIAPDEDLYGWDAELTRQCSEVPCYPKLRYRRAGGQKKSLLYRVFSGRM